MSITKDELMDLEYNAPVSYGGFKNLTYKGKDEKHAILADRTGEEKRHYIELFLKFGKSL